MIGSITVVGYGLGVLGAGIGIGIVGGMAAQATARQPELAGTIQTLFILTVAFIEALALLGFVLSLIK